MKQLIHPSKQKFVVVLVASLVSFLGFEAASQALAVYQISPFLKIAVVVYLFLLFWQMFIFDLHLKKTGSWAVLERSMSRQLKDRFEYLKEKHHWLNFQNYLILPGVIYWSTIALLFLSPFDEIRKQAWIILGTLGLAVAFWYLKTVFYAHKDAKPPVRQMIFLAKLFASYWSFAAALGTGHYFGYSGEWFGLVVFLLTFLLMYQALFQHHYLGFKTLKFLFFSGILLSTVGYLIYYLWNVNYYSGALCLAAFYNTIWGIVHHKYIDKNLTREMVYEYLAVLFVVLVILFSTTNFAERI